MLVGKLQDNFSRVFIIPPTEKGCLPQFIVRGQFRVLDFTDQVKLNPLDLLFDVRRINKKGTCR